EGSTRFFGGTLILDVLRDVALKYDGTNDEEAFNYFVDNYALRLDAGVKRSLYGVISPEEIDTISKGVSAVHNDYLKDVVEEEGKVYLQLRSGKRQEVEEGSWIVNCSGHLLKEPSPYEPYLSEHQTVLSIQQTSAITFVTSFGAYFLPHLWFMGKLPSVPLYAFNHEKLHQKNRQAYFMAAAAQIVHNIMVIMDHVPFKVINDCGINFDNWYPMHRMMFLVLRLKANKKDYLTHFRVTLDKIEERHQIDCGVLFESSLR
ncbi:MAG: potassium transporter, partial [Bacteroidota bacterium]